jgi:hypothetical protein
MKDGGTVGPEVAGLGKEGEEGAERGPTGVLGVKIELLLLLVLVSPLLVLVNPAEEGAVVYMVLPEVWKWWRELWLDERERGWGVVTERSMLLLLLPLRGVGLCLEVELRGMGGAMDMSSCFISSMGDVGW